jgi:hypothetical protein
MLIVSLCIIHMDLRSCLREKKLILYPLIMN